MFEFIGCDLLPKLLWIFCLFVFFIAPGCTKNCCSIHIRFLNFILIGCFHSSPFPRPLHPPEIRRQMSLGTYFWYDWSILGWYGQSGSTVKESLETIMSNFWGLFFKSSWAKNEFIYFGKYCNVFFEKLHRTNFKKIKKKTLTLWSIFYREKTRVFLGLEISM